MKYIDLHLHSYYSDGFYSPKDLIKKVKKESFSIISLTDHQVIDGIDEAKKEAKKYKIKVINGVEINTKFKDKSLHLLGYNFDIKNKELNLTLRKMQEKRKKNVEEALKLLENQGFKIKKEKIFQTQSKDIGVGLIIDYLKRGWNLKKIKNDFKLKNGQILTLPEIYLKYFLKDKKTILPAVEITFEKAVSLIKKAGGIVILAHPSQQLSWRDDFLFPILKKKGLDGIEAISSHHNWSNIEHYQKIAKELNLLITIGSDYHGDLPEKWKFPIKSLWQYFKVKLNKEIKQLLDRIK